MSKELSFVVLLKSNAFKYHATCSTVNNISQCDKQILVTLAKIVRNFWYKSKYLATNRYKRSSLYTAKQLTFQDFTLKRTRTCDPVQVLIDTFLYERAQVCRNLCLQLTGLVNKRNFKSFDIENEGQEHPQIPEVRTPDVIFVDLET